MPIPDKHREKTTGACVMVESESEVLTLADFEVGDRVVLARAKRESYVGLRGVVERKVKRRDALVIRLDNGERYDADPARVDKENT
jgi:hypothetical protein